MAMFSVGSVMVLLSLGLAIALTYIAIRVKRLVWERDRIFPLMTIALAACLYSLALYFILQDFLVPTVLIEPFC